MDLRSLQENRRHGRPDFPVGIYRMERAAGDPILDYHWHDEAEFLAVESGKAVFQIGLDEYKAHAGDILFIPGGELHGAYPWDDSPCAYTAIVFDMGWLAAAQDSVASRLLEPLRRGELVLPPHGTADLPWGAAASRRMAELRTLEGMADPVSELRIKGGLHLLLAEFAGSGRMVRREPWQIPNAGTPDSFKRVLTYIEEHYARKLAVAELAGIAGMSEGHFSRVFKTYLRKTPIEYLNGYRLRRAAAKLRQPGVSVSETAGECGFDNFSYFSKTFKAAYGCTPSEYRKRTAGAE